MKTVLITGCSGLVGTYLIKKFLKENFIVVGVDIKPVQINISYEYEDFFKYECLDLTADNNVRDVLNRHNPDVVVNAFGVKGSPIRAKESPVDFLYPSFKINTELINQCSKRDIWLVFMSSVGVYAPSEKFVESDVWKTLPSEHDWFPSWSKRMGELLLEAYKVQYGYKKWSIIRPANIYGEYDDFTGGGTVISSTVKKVYHSDGTIECWGDGSPVRDFVYGEDVADAIYEMYDKQINDIVNFGSAEEITIKYMVESLILASNKTINIVWDPTKPNGDLRRQMDITKQKEYGLLPKTSFKDGLRKVYSYYCRLEPVGGINISINDYLKYGYYVGKTDEIIKNKEEFFEKIDLLVKSSETKDMYKYRLDYNIFGPHEKYKVHLSEDEIPLRDQFIIENNRIVGQRWWESYGQSYTLDRLKEYFHKISEEFVAKLYPEYADNLSHVSNFTLYENGDFIKDHRDGKNEGRICVILIYLSHEKDYNDGGGKLIIEENKIRTEVLPTNDNFCILDFTQNNPEHSVEAVKNNFRRFTYIDFIYKKDYFFKTQENNKLT
jgi:GDP-L-fucose synthase